MPPALDGGFLTTGLPEKSPVINHLDFNFMRPSTEDSVKNFRLLTYRNGKIINFRYFELLNS